MSSAKRYDISEFGGGMVEVEEGAWYHSDDYDALAADNQLMRDLLRQLWNVSSNGWKTKIDAALAGSKESVE